MVTSWLLFGQTCPLLYPQGECFCASSATLRPNLSLAIPGSGKAIHPLHRSVPARGSVHLCSISNDGNAVSFACGGNCWTVGRHPARGRPSVREPWLRDPGLCAACFVEPAAILPRVDDLTDWPESAQIIPLSTAAHQQSIE